MASVMNQQSGIQMEAPDTVVDPLANMSKHQLYLVLSQMKNLIHHNQQQARQILISNPELAKTLFQAQIMLGMVPAPDMLPLANTSTEDSYPTQIEPMQSDEPHQGQDHEQVSTQAQDHQHMSIQGQAHEQRSTQGQDHQRMFPRGPDYPYRYTQGQDHQHRSTQAQVHPHRYIQGQVEWSQPLVATSPYHESIQTHEQPGSHMNVMALHSHTQSPVQHVLLQSLQPAPLPQQPLPSEMLQYQKSHSVDFHSSQDTPVYHHQIPYQMSQGDMGTDKYNGNVELGGRSQEGRGPSVVSPGWSTFDGWDLAMAPTGYHSYPGPSSGSLLTHAQGYSQSLPQHQPQPLQEQPQVQMFAMEAEQQKALLEQVMSLTHEQIDLLPPEQRKQVLQVQQAFRSQIG